MKYRSISLALVISLAAVLAYQSIAAVNAAPAAPIAPGAGNATSRPAASCGLLSFARTDYQFGRFGGVTASGDFNGDGKPDLAGIADDGADIFVTLNDGGGHFSAPISYTVGPYQAGDVAVGDFNGDGKLDLAVAIVDSQTDQHNAVMLFLGNGNGTFQPGGSFALAPYPGGIAVADFNHDGKLDLVISNQINAYLFVLLGNGDGTFQPMQRVIVGNSPMQPIVADFNGDGNPDIAVANQGSGSVSLLLGNGDGSFQPPAFFPVGSFPLSAVAGDFNGDGKLDLIVSSSYDSRRMRVLLLPGDGHGRFGPAIVYYQTYVPNALAAADIDGDGHPDLVLANSADNTATVWRGSASGDFNPPVGFSVGQNPSSILIVDLNGDSKPDLVVSTAAGASVLLNTCAPSTTTPPTSTPNIPTTTPRPTDTPYPTTTPCVIPFTDLYGNPFQQAIEYLHCYRVVNGYGNSYRPAETADRAQFAKVVVIGFGLFASEDTYTQYFSDVPLGHYAYHYVGDGYQSGILDGFDAATCAAAGAAYPCYLPERAITRGQLTKMVVLTAFFPLVTPGTPTFSDVPPSNPFYPYIETAYAQGIIKGYPDGTFRPNENIRRDQMAGIVYNGVVNPNRGLAGKAGRATRHRP